MNPRDARKIASFLVVGNCIVAVALATLAIYVAVEILIPEPNDDKTAEQISEPNGGQKNDQTGPEMKQNVPSMDKYRACWEGDILDKVPAKAPEKPVPAKPEPAKEAIKNVPWEWGGAMVHTNRKKSYAILIEKGSQKQILVNEGDMIESFRVVSIREDGIEIVGNSGHAIIQQPMPWLDIGKPDVKMTIQKKK